MLSWPFADPPNFAAYSTRGVMERGEPILLVSHEDEDGAWQFIGYAWEPEDLVLVCLEHAVATDPSVSELADLPRGWAAERASKDTAWCRYQLPPDDEQ